MSNLFGINSIGVNGNVAIGGNMSAANMGTLRNKLINGDMRVDRANLGTGHAVVAGVSASNVATSVDRFQLAVGPASGALCADQVGLSAADKAAVGGAFDRAVQISALPTVGLIAHLPFENAVTDQSGAGILGAPTVTGTAAYSGLARVGDRSIYFGNEANILAGGNTIGNTYVTIPYTTALASPITISCWVNSTKLALNDASIIWGIGASTSPMIQLQNMAAGNTLGIFANISPSVLTGTITMNVNTWYHITFVFVPNSYMALYVNGNLISNVTTTTSSIGQPTSIRIGERVDTGYASPTYRPFAGYVDDFRIYNRVLTPSEIAALAAFGGMGQAPSSGLTARLPFDGVLTDVLGQLTSPTVTGTAAYSPNCRSGTAALDLTANTSGGAASNMVSWSNISPAITNSGNGFSISTWVNIQNTTNMYHWLNLSSGPSSYGLEMGVANGYFLYGISGVFSVYGASTGTPVLNRWYNVVHTLTTNMYCLYIDGVLINSTSLSATYNYNYLRIGGRVNNDAGYAFKGLIDEVRIYNTALTPSQVAGIYYFAAGQSTGLALYRQPLDGTQLQDLGWGTTAAQPATLSCWIKNQTAVEQSYTLALNNAGHGLVAYLPFEASATDVLGGLTGPVRTGTLAYSAAAKVGSFCLDLTANTINVAVTTALTYSLPNPITLPLSISLWINLSSAVGVSQYAVPISFGVSNSVSTYVMIENGSIYSTIYLNGSATPVVTAIAAISTNTWTHVSFVYVGGSVPVMYINGVAITGNTTALPSSGIFTATNGSTANLMRLGSYTQGGATAFKGLIDDVKIFNRALSAAEVAAIYAANASSTAASATLMPRSVIYKTPSIAAGAWQKVSVVIPGDTVGFWPSGSNATAGFVSVALAAGALYVTPIGAAASNNTSNVWNMLPMYGEASIQIPSASSNNLLALTGASSVLMTGLQLERGDLATPFEQRPVAVESLMSGLSMDSAGRLNLSVDGNISAGNLGMFRNRIINGDMRIDQRNAGATLTINTGSRYTVDRWICGWTSGMTYTVGQDTTAPPGFRNSIKTTQVTAASNTTNDGHAIYQGIEGHHFVDFGWGTSNAIPMTISFWHNITGIPAGSKMNMGIQLMQGTGYLYYPFTFTVKTPGSWEYITYTIPPPSSYSPPTLLTDAWAYIRFEYWANWGTKGASDSWYSTYTLPTDAVYLSSTSGWTRWFTGVQVEKGPIATPFEVRPYGVELQLCQRYYQSFINNTAVNYMLWARIYAPAAGAGVPLNVFYKVNTRVAPSFTRVGTWTVGNTNQPYALSISTDNILLLADAFAAGDANYYAASNVGFVLSAEY